MRTVIKVMIIVIFLMACLSCEIVFVENDFNSYYEGYELVSVRDDTLKVHWDDSLGEANYDSSDLGSYNVCVKSHGTDNWIQMVSISEGEELIANLSFLGLDSGYYDIGIEYESSSGLKTNMHSSLDSNADPSVGWYVHY